VTVSGPEPFLLLPPGSRSAAVVRAVAALHGGALETDCAHQPCAVLADLDLLASLPPADLAGVARTAPQKPLCLFRSKPAAAEPNELRRVVEALTGLSVTLTGPRKAREYRFASAPELWPFSGMSLREREPRTGVYADPGPGRATPLILTEEGCVCMKWSAAGRTVFLALAPIGDDASVRLLKREFRPDRFAGLLPLMLFVRHALGRSAWRTPQARACFVVDDANLRLPRYGFVDYRQAVACSRQHAFHLALAMIPLDFRKTREPVAALFRDNPAHLSVVPHGVDHRRAEFVQEIAPERARAHLADGLARMATHERSSGVRYPRAMTIPREMCSATWMNSMRAVGLDAAIASRGCPFKPEAELWDPLYELHPAETSFRALPVVNRFSAEHAWEDLLFQAWLGKPVIVYAHHYFWREGPDRLVDLVRFVNRQVSPRWMGIGAILQSNYQMRYQGAKVELRVFSNHVRLAADHASAVTRITKPTKDFPADEAGWIDDVEVPLEQDRDVGFVVTCRNRFHEPMNLRLGPRHAVVADRPQRPSGRSRLRRLATEVRDQLQGAGRLGLR
jgi:hypothetical protein